MSDRNIPDEQQVARNSFADYVTSTAFSMSLSRPMCEAMEFWKADSMTRGGAGFQVVTSFPQVATCHSLQRRGLIEHYVMDERGRRSQRLTEAGRLLYPLLVLAGLVRSEEHLREALALRGTA